MNMDLYNTLKKVAPGTQLRAGLDNIINAKTGALIVIGNTKEVLDITHGGFYINCEYSPSHIYELAKMDGAIIVSNDCRRILYANVQLFPCQYILSNETGTRHKTAERVARQTGVLVIAISKRREVITLYKSDYKYVLKDISEILSKANQAVQTLEKYKDTLKQAMFNLTALEFKNKVTLYEVTNAIQKIEMVWRIGNEINMYISELGMEGRLLNMQVVELMDGVKEDRINLIKDYINKEYKDYITVIKDISGFNSQQLLNLNLIANLLGYNKGLDTLDIKLESKGYRVLSKIPRIPSNVLENIIFAFGSLQNIINASPYQLDLVEGVGEARTLSITEGLKRYQSQFL
ncbi:diadenylate cyclase; DNA integrity scanning protein; cell cycle checkpoint DNA scanning protein [[Clostridium] ultunense Esp]|uniref:Diadenylate cyclase DNA integrity scanning protein cell cycle checkpoint DNA scanning protein n=1 Tax=[Clostridium] ultunense Esp TaxID=1288971 RepID=M1YUQ2_9FIRM|nr:DNA integrity scanning diadenylate cyclase DisA [Schnuerera ultunensis]CCQ94260.1 diadenylate cyclase; DNA integrity scanning protein; cell cycle checkpoint DNA scanning protein [[Clostridium] ultunense Esp]SHD78620.1 diadenylate cyclase; DNA integrity scanning protein; cell cycle checkpoint DNA scanning protein [[Clostridium] ultunense Esp]